jgi:teichuronic acid biosynthesis glycosyltransferase TuaC
MATRLRIVSVCRTLPNPEDSGTGIYVLNRLAAMARHADLTILQPVPYCPGVRPLPTWAQRERRTVGDTEIRICPMPYVPGVLKFLDGGWLENAIASRVRELHSRRPIDLIDAHFGYPEGVGCVRLARKLRIPAFITLRGLENEYLRKPFIGGQLAHALRSAQGCISVSHSLRALAIDAGAAPERVKVVHNGLDTAVFQRGDRDQARRSLGVAPRVPLIVSVGNLIQRKRHHVLVEAFALARRKFGDAELVILGGETVEPDYAPRLRARIRELGVETSVRLAGNLQPPAVATWLQAADVFALATAREGCCNAILEALAVGVPVVSTPVGDNAHFVRDAENGYLVPVDDSAAMARALEQALARDDWGARTISTTVQVEQWDRVARDVLAFFSERLEASTGHGASSVVQI